MTTMTHTTRFTRIARLLVALAMALLASIAGASDWAEEALLLQEHLDINNSLNWTTFIGTHNSYNAELTEVAGTDRGGWHPGPHPGLPAQVRG